MGDFVGGVKILGKRAKKVLEENIRKNEKVFFCLKGIFGQVMVALDKRLLIIKPGFFAGATFGSRVTSFYYKDITGVEINTGLIFGVIEICTPSHQGSTEKDFWSIGNKDPFKISNCLPIEKSKLKYYKPYLEKLQNLIEKCKEKR